MWITYKNRLEEYPQQRNLWALDQKIEIFHNEVFGWQLDIADKMLNSNIEEVNLAMRHSAFAALSIVLSSFEMFAKYYHGYIEKDTHNMQSKEYFCRGIELVYPNMFIKTERHQLYSRVRCGLYHLGKTLSNVALNANYEQSFQFISPMIVINPHKLSKDLLQYLETYTQQLHEESPEHLIVTNFIKRFNHDYGIK